MNEEEIENMVDHYVHTDYTKIHGHYICPWTSMLAKVTKAGVKNLSTPTWTD